MAQLNMKITEEQKERVRVLAEQLEVSMTTAIMIAVREKLEELEARKLIAK